MKHTVKETKRQPGQSKTPELDDKIRLRAYEIYQQRGRTDGSELEDWVQAEVEVLGTDDIERTA
jgi:hypothetical protein